MLSVVLFRRLGRGDAGVLSLILLLLSSLGGVSSVFVPFLLSHLMLHLAPLKAAMRLEPGRNGTELLLQDWQVKLLTYVLAQAAESAALRARVLLEGTTPWRAVQPANRK
jgi:hypothetical protein